MLISAAASFFHKSVRILCAAGLALSMMPVQTSVAGAPGSLLPGGNSKDPTDIAADKLDYFDKEAKLVYAGNVIVIQGETRMKATMLTIYLDRSADNNNAAAQPAKGGSQMRRMEGKGPITIANKDQIGTGDTLVYDKGQNTVILSGHVTLTQNGNVTKGDRLVYDLTKGQAVVSSGQRVHSLILQNESSGQAH